MNAQFLVGMVRIAGYLCFVFVASAVVSAAVLFTYDRAARVVTNLWEKRPWK